ncbi:MAG: methylaspartate mutase [Actinophytocola sp.]|uniref:methylaspartate mutase n=1 Tax=Actinophytocola sp. TaxID=1872138 RepID=UPI003C7780D5
MTGFGRYVAEAAAAGGLVVQPRMGFGSPRQMRRGLAAVRDSGTTAVGTITLDSYTRVGSHETARAALAAGDDLNGYPIVAYPLDTTRAVVDRIAGDDFPVQVRHGSARPQDIVTASIAAGLYATEGGPLSYCLPYSRVPVSEAVRAWRESCLLLATLREDGLEPHLESFGGCMLGQLCPPSLLVAISVLEGVFFQRHGVRSVSLSYAQQTHPDQDAEAVLALRTLAGEHLAGDDWHVVIYTYMGVFPRTPHGATALLAEAARLAVRTGSARLIVKTVAEAHRIPTIEENVAALRTAAAAAASARYQPSTQDTGVLAEARALVDAVLMLDDDLGTALIRAVRMGYLDVPYCLHPDNPGATRAFVDRDGHLRWSRLGALPLRGIADAGGSHDATATGLLRALSHVERRFDDAAIEQAAAAQLDPLPLG